MSNAYTKSVACRRKLAIIRGLLGRIGDLAKFGTRGRRRPEQHDHSCQLFLERGYLGHASRYAITPVRIPELFK